MKYRKVEQYRRTANKGGWSRGAGNRVERYRTTGDRNGQYRRTGNKGGWPRRVGNRIDRYRTMTGMNSKEEQETREQEISRVWGIKELDKGMRNTGGLRGTRKRHRWSRRTWDRVGRYRGTENRAEGYRRGNGLLIKKQNLQ